MKAHVLIAGGGIGGLTVALALIERGFRVSVFERSPELKEIGAGFAATPNGTRILYALGLRETIGEVAVRVARRELRLWNTGRLWTLAGHGADSEKRYGAPYLAFHRGDLHAILATEVRRRQPDAIHLDARCIGLNQDERSVSLLFDGRPAVEGDVLIGADGVHSEIRKSLFGPDRAQFIGEVAWRGLIPIENLPERMRENTTCNWIGPGGSVTVYPVRGGTLVNFIGLIERDDWRVESWIEQGTTEECLRDFTGWHEDILTMIRAIDTPFKWALFLRDPQPRWSVGRATLLGDACHAMVPYLGQGANMALEDAYVLARCLDSADDIAAALSRYEEARRSRTTEVVIQSMNQSKRIHDPVLADPVKAENYVETNWAPEKVKGRYDWIYDYDATAVQL
jgi:2-polyprenyl-6-methoxyphenol hydroxylase-like FAD-dependent oxidoreductase